MCSLKFNLKKEVKQMPGLLPEYWQNDALRSYDAVMSHSRGYQTMLRIYRAILTGCRIILDSGCGSGNATLELLEDNHAVYAMDVNEAAINKLISRAQGNPRLAEACCGNVHELPWGDEHFDGVLSSLVFWTSEQPELFLSEHFRVLKRGGILVISGPGPRAKFNYRILLAAIQSDLAQQGLFPRLTRDWEIFARYVASNVRQPGTHWYTDDEVTALCEQAGFAIRAVASNPMFWGEGYIIGATRP